MGDVGNALSGKQLAALAETDVLLALAGGPPTIELSDLYHVIQTVRPRMVIPMHYRIPGPRFFMLPVTGLTGYFPKGSVEWMGSSEIELSCDTLSEETRIVVLKPALVGQPD
jgi:hypothetical protein